MKPIKKAIVAVAGLGTRFLPATKAIPKEMLPVVDKPVVQYIVEELVEAGIEEIIFVTSLGKRALEDHFDYNFELAYKLKAKGKLGVLDEVKKISNLASFAYVRQPLQKGDGHAVLMAKNLVKDEPFLVAFGDDLTWSPGKKNGTQQMIETYEKYGDPVIGTYTVPTEESNKYGMVSGQQVEDYVMQMDGLIEKPDPKDAPSNEGAIGKYIFTPDLMKVLEDVKPGKDGEIRVTTAIDTYVKERPIYARSIQGERFDCGSKLGWIKANVAFGLEVFGDDLKDYLKSVC